MMIGSLVKEEVTLETIEEMGNVVVGCSGKKIRPGRLGS